MVVDRRGIAFAAITTWMAFFPVSRTAKRSPPLFQIHIDNLVSDFLVNFERELLMNIRQDCDDEDCGILMVTTEPSQNGRRCCKCEQGWVW